ncbi:hypothetical protein R6Z07F_012720 [Ovis aries]
MRSRTRGEPGPSSSPLAAFAQGQGHLAAGPSVCVRFSRCPAGKVRALGARAPPGRHCAAGLHFCFLIRPRQLAVLPRWTPRGCRRQRSARWHVPLTAWAPRPRAPLPPLGLDQLRAGRSATCALGAHRGLRKGVTRTPSATPHAELAQPERPPACGGEAARQIPRIQAKLSGRRALIPGLRVPPAWDVQKIRSVSRFTLVHLIHAAV